jgi:amidase
VATNLEAARSRADAADVARAGGENWGPLHGLPMTIKDSYEVAGMPTTSGAPELADHRPATNATSVQRLLDAGAIVFGKTNLPLWAGDFQSYNEVYGTTGNPFDVDRVPGGSSGGAAAALASGMTPLELGSDIGGSIRNPAHFCGVYGHKPTHGIIPMTGHIPGPPGSLAEADLAVAGPLARNVPDLERALDVLVGPDDWNRAATTVSLPASRHRALRDFRVAAWLDDPNYPISVEVGDRIQNALDALARAGVKIDDKARPRIDSNRSSQIYQKLLQSIMGAALPPAAREAITEQVRQLSPDDTSLHPTILRGSVLSHADWLRANEARMHLRVAWREFFQSYDVMLCPIMPTVAFPHDHREWSARTVEINGESHPYLAQIFWAGLTGVVYLPSTAVPVGLGTSGLPVGVQVVADFLDDRTALRFAELMEPVTGGFQRPPES